MSLPTTPRVNSSMLATYVGQPVRFVGKIVEQNGTHATMQASDHGQVQINMNHSSQYTSQYIEVIGEVQSDGSINEMVSASFGDSFDLETYNQLVVKMQQFSTVF
ncbi:hypothetical protein MVEG_04211 [Podila verticillata NRRL 6337]|nr:MAG: replication factor A protein 3 [Podila humilis]KFH69398.1 hypothetical protein MVEG_04211 [Podila verticillata NRRL 6337]